MAKEFWPNGATEYTEDLKDTDYLGAYETTSLVPGNKQRKIPLLKLRTWLTNFFISKKDTIADLKATIPFFDGQLFDVSGYYIKNDLFEIPRYKYDAASVATPNNGSVLLPDDRSLADPGRYLWSDNIVYVNPMLFGAKGDGVTDDTIPVQYVFDNFDEIVIPGNVFAVTSVKIRDIYNFIFSYDGTLKGIATSSEDAILVFEDAREVVLRGRLNVASDGNEVTPIYQQNYKCAIHIKSDPLTSDNSQFMYLQGLRTSNIKAGIVSGGFLGESFQPFIAQSEIWIEDYQCRGVLQPFYQNASNAYITLSNCLLVGNQFEASSFWWVSADGWCVRNDVGVLNLVGCEIQRSLSVGYAIYGRSMYFTNGIHEYSCPNYFTGTVTLSDISNGFFGSGSQNWAEIPATYTVIDDGVPVVSDVTGKLLLQNAKVRRPSGTSGFSGSNMITCDANEYRIIIDNSDLEEWRYTLNEANTHLIKGGKLQINSTLITSVLGDLDLGVYKKENLLLSSDGTDMITTQDQTDKSGWEVEGTPAASSWFAQSPDTYTVDGDIVNAIRMYSPATSLRIQTPLIPIGGINYILLDMLAKSVSTGTGYLRIYINWYDYAGVSVGQEESFDFNFTRFEGQGYQDDLIPLRTFTIKDKNATQMRVEFFLSTMTFDFTDFKIILN